MTRHYSGFTLTEGLALTAILCVALMLVGVQVVGGSIRRNVPPRLTCSTNLSGIYMGLYTYSISNHDAFPMAGHATPGAHAIGFADGNRHTGKGAKLDDNVTASLWLTVRQGSTLAKHWTCPSAVGDERDCMTDNGTAAGIPVSLDDAYDFSMRKNLSYSPINMYHTAVGKSWSANVKPDWVIMGDNNNNNAPAATRHTLIAGALVTDVQAQENSTNHSGREGQNLLFGDGHVAFSTDPFQGPHNDNVYAMVHGGKNAPPTLGNSDGDAAKNPKVADDDVVLLPVSGNGGGAGSLDPKD